MLQDIWNLINKLGELISTIWNFLMQAGEWILKAIPLIKDSIRYAYLMIDSFPIWLKGFAIACILISVVYTFLGWAGGDSE